MMEFHFRSSIDYTDPSNSSLPASSGRPLRYHGLTKGLLLDQLVSYTILMICSPPLCEHDQSMPFIQVIEFKNRLIHI